MGLWGKIGKVLLTAAPYIAAPFTGGASLSLAPLANKAVTKWNEHDAQKQYEKTGIAPGPDKLNSIMGMVGDFASGYSGGGGFGGAGGTLGGKTGSILRDIGSQTGAGGGLGGVIARGAGGNRPPYIMDAQGGYGGGGYSSPGFAGGTFGGGGMNTTQPMGGNRSTLGNTIGSAIGAIMSRQGIPGSDGRTQPQMGPQYGSAGPQRGGGQIYSGPIGRRLGVSNQVDQSNPNLSYALAQGRAEAMRNQRRQPQMMQMMDWSTPYYQQPDEEEY